MADLTRDIGEINPNTYVRQGVQKPSALSLAAAVGDEAINLDAALAKARLKRDSDALRTVYEIGSPASIEVQEGALSAADQQQVDAVSNDLAKRKAAVEQGRMTYDTYRLQGERLLRLAISKRPGLASEFRQTAALHLGVDVVGSSVDILAAAERGMNKEDDDKGGPDTKRMRDQLDSVGIPAGLYSDDQVAAVYQENLPAIAQYVQQQARNSIVTTEASTIDAGNKINKPKATADFLAKASDYQLEIFTDVNRAYANIQTGQFGTEQIMAGIQAGRAKTQSYITNLRQAAAAGDVDADTAEKAIAGIQAYATQLEGVLTGEQNNDLLKKRIEGIKLYAQNIMLDQDNVPQMAAAVEIFTPEIMTQFVQPGGSFSKSAMLALANALNNTGDPTTNATNAGTSASGVIATVLDRGAAKTNPDAIPAMGVSLVNLGGSFLTMPAGEWKSDYVTGPRGFITVLNLQREGLAKSLPENQSVELATTVARVAGRNLRALAYSLGREHSDILKKVDIGVDINTGNMITPKKGLLLTAAESGVVDQYNRAFSGRNVITTISALGKMEANEAIAFLNQATTATPRVAPAAKPAAAPAPQGASPYPDGTELEGPDGKDYVVRNGVPVMK